MTNSFFPKSDSSLVVWATNYKEKIVLHGVALGMTPAEIDAEIDICKAVITAINEVNAQKTTLKKVIDSRDGVIDLQGAELRTDIARHKTATGYTEAIGQDLGIIGSTVEFDPNTFKPVISVELFGGNIRFRFVKAGVNGLNIYKRQKGTSNFTLLSRTTKSPFDFHPTLSEANKPEHWEFRAFGVINDVEIGLASDIVEIVFGE